MRALRMSLMMERLFRLIKPALPTPPPALVRKVQGAQRPLSLEVAYHPARCTKGVVLIPKDAYFYEVEALLNLE